MATPKHHRGPVAAVALSFSCLALATQVACGAKSLAFKSTPDQQRPTQGPSSSSQNTRENDVNPPLPPQAADALVQTPVPPSVSSTSVVQPVVSANTGVQPAPIPAVDTPVALPSQATVPGDLCSGRKEIVKIMILDFKSGWFAGDGGQTFTQITNHACQQTIQVSYAHIIANDITSTLADNVESKQLFAKCTPLQDASNKDLPGVFATTGCELGSLTGFDQLFLLSGSDADGLDVLTVEPEFVKMVARVAEFSKVRLQAGLKAGVFLGAGLNNVSHGNVFAQALRPEWAASGVSLFSGIETPVEGTMPSPHLPTWFAKGGLVSGSGTAAGTFNANHPLFAQLGELFDYKKEDHIIAKDAYPGMGYQHAERDKDTNLGKCFGDKLDAAKVTVLATDHCNQPIIGEQTFGKLHLIADGNMARFYGGDAQSYFARIMNDLLR